MIATAPPRTPRVRSSGRAISDALALATARGARGHAATVTIRATDLADLRHGHQRDCHR